MERLRAGRKIENDLKLMGAHYTSKAIKHIYIYTVLVPVTLDKHQEGKHKHNVQGIPPRIKPRNRARQHNISNIFVGFSNHTWLNAKMDSWRHSLFFVVR